VTPYLFSRASTLPPLRPAPANVRAFSLEGTERVVPLDATSPDVGAAPSGTKTKGEYREIRIFFGTDRDRTGSPGPRKVFGPGRSLDGGTTFGYCDMTVPRSHVRGEIERPFQFLIFELPEDRSRHITIEDVKILENEAGFHAALKAELAEAKNRPGGGADDLLVFVHGYNVAFDDAAYRTAQLACDLDFKGVAVLYSWPSQATTQEYTYDEANIDWSGPHVRDFLEGLAAKSGARRIHVIAHSMGNRAVAAALENLAAHLGQSAASGRPPFQEVIFAAPDIDQGRLAQLLPTVRGMAARFTLYGSSDDEAIRASHAVHGYDRAGEGGDRLLISPGLDSIDASGIDLNLLGHSYYGDVVLALADLAQLLDGRNPGERHLQSHRRGQLPYWAFVLPAPVGMLAGRGLLYSGVVTALIVYALLSLIALRRRRMRTGSESKEAMGMSKALRNAAVVLCVLLAVAAARFLFARTVADGAGATVIRVADWALIAFLAGAAAYLAFLQVRTILSLGR
jgi:esterase/lipase superfamily enzyme